jgi:hypothetical protein
MCIAVDDGRGNPEIVEAKGNVLKMPVNFTKDLLTLGPRRRDPSIGELIFFHLMRTATRLAKNPKPMLNPNRYQRRLGGLQIIIMVVAASFSPNLRRVAEKKGKTEHWMIPQLNLVPGYQ